MSSTSHFVANCLTAISILTAIAGCGYEAPFSIPVVANNDFTFFVASDTHYGLSQWADNEQVNKATIDAMKALPGMPYPDQAGGGLVGIPVGVLVTGDLTDTGEWPNWYGYWVFGWRDGFRTDYGFSGERRLPYPIFEAYGNHDISNGRTFVIDAIKARNQLRKGINVSELGLQSSWDWGGIHFVNLGLYPGDSADAHGSLPFLRQDLQTHLTDPRQKIILFHHYGFDSFSTDGAWWTEDEREAYYAVIKDYNVIAIFNGHLHAQDHLQWHGLDSYIVGNAFGGYFLAVHVTAGQLVVAGYTQNGWGQCWIKSLISEQQK